MFFSVCIYYCFYFEFLKCCVKLIDVINFHWLFFIEYVYMYLFNYLFIETYFWKVIFNEKFYYFLGCQECSSTMEGDCAMHRVHSVISDKPVPSRARATLPASYLIINWLSADDGSDAPGNFFFNFFFLHKIKHEACA